MEGDLTLNVISLAAGVTCLGLGAYVYWKNPVARSGRAFFVTMVLAALASFLTFIVPNSPDAGTAEVLGRILASVSTLVWLSYIYLVMYVPVERKSSWILRNKGKSAAAIAVLAILPALLNYDFSSDRFGFWFAPSTNLFIWLMLTLLIIIIPMSLMAFVYVSATEKEVRRSAVVLGAGVLLPMMVYIIELLLMQSGIDIPHLLAIGFFMTGAVFSWSLFRYKTFVIEPVKEVGLEGPVPRESSFLPVNGLPGGHCDLIKSKRSDPAYRLFVTEVAAGKSGLVVTRVHPEQIREKYGFVKTPILWLSSQPGSERVDPAALSILQHTMIDFLRREQASVVLLDGLEYLMAENPLDKVLRFIYSIHDAVVVSDSIFIVPLDPEVMSPKDLALVEREFSVLEVPTMPNSSVTLGN